MRRWVLALLIVLVVLLVATAVVVPFVLVTTKKKKKKRAAVAAAAAMTTALITAAPIITRLPELPTELPTTAPAFVTMPGEPTTAPTLVYPPPADITSDTPTTRPALPPPRPPKPPRKEPDLPPRPVPSTTGDGLLPPLTSLDEGKAPWNIRQNRWPERAGVQDGMIKLSFKKGVRGNESGAALFANPWGILPRDGVTMSYEVFLPDSWDWVKAGKFPGIGIGTRQGEHASGGKVQDTAGSFRVMWQKPEKDGVTALIKGYLYLAIKGGIAKWMGPQGPKAKAVINDDDRTGFSAWYKKEPTFYAKKGQWNSIAFTVKLNTVGKADGYLSMTVNGVTRSIDDVVWRDNPNVHIVDMYFVSIFGGSTMDFAVKQDTYALFRNVRFAPA